MLARMALNVIWVGFLLIGIFTALCKLVFWGDFAPFQQMLLMLLGGEDGNGESVTSRFLGAMRESKAREATSTRERSRGASCPL